jgi:hypothetical protein
VVCAVGLTRRLVDATAPIERNSPSAAVSGRHELLVPFAVHSRHEEHPVDTGRWGSAPRAQRASEHSETRWLSDMHAGLQQTPYRIVSLPCGKAHGHTVSVGMLGMGVKSFFWRTHLHHCGIPQQVRTWRGDSCGKGWRKVSDMRSGGNGGMRRAWRRLRAWCPRGEK